MSVIILDVISILDYEFVCYISINIVKSDTLKIVKFKHLYIVSSMSC